MPDISAGLEKELTIIGEQTTIKYVRC